MVGIAPRALIAAQLQVIALVRQISDTYVQMFRDTAWREFVADGAPPEQLERIRSTVARLQPAAAQALLASFRTEMAAAVERGVQAELEALEDR